MESFSSSASRSPRPASPSTWRGGGALPRRDGRRSFATMRTTLSHGPLRRADNLVPAALWFADHGPAADPVVWGDRAPDGRMDRQSAHRSLWLGTNPSLLNQ